MKILAIDDDPIILELLEQFIAEIGQHTLVTAVSGNDAVGLLDDGRFDCFLVDIQMPGMDGVELTRHIRAQGEYLMTPIVMLTAMSEKRYVDAAFAAGATDYVTKPFEMSELRARLRVMQELANSRSGQGKTGTSPDDTFDTANPPLFQPLSIRGVDNLIDFNAMENYVAQLSRTALFGSTVFALAVRRIEDLHGQLDGPDYVHLVSEVGRVITEVMSDHQFLMTYGGNGVFICVTEQGWRPDLAALKNAINLNFAQRLVAGASGERLQPRVVVGDAVRLGWKSDVSLLEALAQAHASAETASEDAEGVIGNIRALDTYLSEVR